jgi:biopolymer transport protein ExbD
MKIRTDNEESLVLNLTPMIDVVFLLIIFFMVSTTFLNLEKEMDLNLPEAQSGRPEEMKQDEIIINVLADGRMKVGDQFLEMDDLVERLKQVALANPKTPVTIRGDRDTVFQNAVRAMDACGRADLHQISVGILSDPQGSAR